MQWDAGPHAGFSRVEPWLPAHARSATVNVAAQKDDPASLLCCYRNLLALRRESTALQAGALEWLDLPRRSSDVVAYRRVHGDERVDVYLNFSSRQIPLQLGDRTGRTVFSNRTGERVPSTPERSLGPYEAIVVWEADGRRA